MGASTAEYLAVLVLITLAVTVVAPGNVAGSITGAVQDAFCRISGGSCPSAPGPTATPDLFEPARCDLSERTYQGSVEIGAHVFQLDGGLNLVRTDHSDGMTTFNVVDEAGFGVSASKGVDVVLGRTYGNSVGGTVSLTRAMGDSWSVPTDQAEALQSQLQRAVPAQRFLEERGALGDFIEWVASPVVDLRLPAPTTTFEVGGAKVAAGATVATGGSAGKPLSVNVGGQAAAQIGVELNHEDGSKTTWVELGAKAAVDVLVVDNLHSGDGVRRGAGELGGKAIGRLTRDRDGVLTQVEIQTVVAGGRLAEERPDLAVLLAARDELTDPRTSTVPPIGGEDDGFQPQDLLELGRDRWQSDDLTQTLTIPLDNDADRKIVELWAGGAPTPFANEAIRQLGDEKGINTLVNSRQTGVRSGVGLRTEKGGLVASGESAERRPFDALHLGPRQSTGRREWQQTTGCGAAAGG